MRGRILVYIRYSPGQALLFAVTHAYLSHGCHAYVNRSFLSMISLRYRGLFSSRGWYALVLGF